MKFAYSYSHQGYSVSPTAKLAEIPAPSGKGLFGVAGAAEAAFIKRKVESMGRIADAIIKVRYEPLQVPVTDCHCPACPGMHPNGQWKVAVFTLAQHLKVHVLAGRRSTHEMRMAYIVRYFFGKTRAKSFARLAMSSGVHVNTISTQMSIVNRWLKGEFIFVEINGKKEKRFFPGMDMRVMTEIDGILKDAGYVKTEPNMTEAA